LRSHGSTNDGTSETRQPARAPAQEDSQAGQGLLRRQVEGAPHRQAGGGRALAYSYRDRRQKKRQFRSLWIVRINAAARLNGLSYSRFMSGLRLAGIDLNRKMLADLAVRDAEGFAAVASVARGALAEGAASSSASSS